MGSPQVALILTVFQRSAASSVGTKAEDAESRGENTHDGINRGYSRFFVQQSEPLFWYFELLRQPPLESLHGLLLGQGELEAGAGGGVDVEIHGGLARDGLAGRSPATGAAAGAGMLVHPITCGQRVGGGGWDEQGRMSRAWWGSSVPGQIRRVGYRPVFGPRTSGCLTSSSVSSRLETMRIFPPGRVNCKRPPAPFVRSVRLPPFVALSESPYRLHGHAPGADASLSAKKEPRTRIYARDPFKKHTHTHSLTLSHAYTDARTHTTKKKKGWSSGADAFSTDGYFLSVVCAVQETHGPSAAEPHTDGATRLLAPAAAPVKYRRRAVSLTIPLPPSLESAHRAQARRPISGELRRDQGWQPMAGPDPHPRGGQAS